MQVTLSQPEGCAAEPSWTPTLPARPSSLCLQDRRALWPPLALAPWAVGGPHCPGSAMPAQPQWGRPSGLAAPVLLGLKSRVVQMVKNWPAALETRGKAPWRRKWQPTPVCLPAESGGWRSLVGYSPWGLKEWRLEGATDTFTFQGC